MFGNSSTSVGAFPPRNPPPPPLEGRRGMLSHRGHLPPCLIPDEFAFVLTNAKMASLQQ